MKDRLSKMWESQKRFSEKLYDVENASEQDKELKTKELALALHHDVSALVSSVNFQNHRPIKHDADCKKIMYEGVDIVRYAMAICALWGFDEDDFHNAWNDKDFYLNQQQVIDNNQWTGQPVFIIDIDDVISNFREDFSTWIHKKRGIVANHQSNDFFFIEALRNTGTSSLALHDEFIDDGGFKTLTANDELISAINKLYENDIWIHVLTARSRENMRSRYDTIKWLHDVKLKYHKIDFAPDKLAFVTRTNYSVNGKILACVDDSPTNCSAYIRHGLNCLMPEKTYNSGVAPHEKLHRYAHVDQFKTIMNDLLVKHT